MTNLKQLHWPLIVGMGALALVHPFMNLTARMAGLGRPMDGRWVTVLISLVWLAIVVLNRVRSPLLTLVFTGVTYGVFIIVISAVLSTMLEGQLSGPLTHPLAVLFVLVTNALWGLVVGLVAWAVQQQHGAGSL
jgi:hypothetical protein